MSLHAELIARWRELEAQAMEAPANPAFAELCHRSADTLASVDTEQRAAFEAWKAALDWVFNEYPADRMITADAIEEAYTRYQQSRRGEKP